MGTLVSPATFRYPAVLAKSVVTADHVSGGRVEPDELRDRASRLARWKGESEDSDAFLANLRESTVKGTVPEAIEQLQELEQAGLTRLMAQRLLHRDLDAIELIGRDVIPALAR